MGADGKFTLYIQKVIVNPLLGRKQMAVDILHPEVSNVKRADIKASISKKFKATEDRIAVFGDVDARKKYDSKTNIARDKVVELPKKTPRKMAKELKGKRKGQGYRQGQGSR